MAMSRPTISSSWIPLAHVYLSRMGPSTGINLPLVCALELKQARTAPHVFAILSIKHADLGYDQRQSRFI